MTALVLLPLPPGEGRGEGIGHQDHPHPTLSRRERAPVALARRTFILTGAALLATPSLARATPAEVAAAIQEITAGATPQPGRVKLDIPVMVENGNAVGVTVGVPDGEPRCTDLYLFAEGNPLPRVLHAKFGPAAGRTQLATRMRLATSQTVIAVARLEDGSFWTDSVDLIVTLAACLE